MMQVRGQTKDQEDYVKKNISMILTKQERSYEISLRLRSQQEKLEEAIHRKSQQEKEI